MWGTKIKNDNLGIKIKIKIVYFIASRKLCEPYFYK